MIAGLWRKIRRNRVIYYESRYDYLQACYNHLVRYNASELAKRDFLCFAEYSAKHFSDESLFDQCNRRLNRAGMP